MANGDDKKKPQPAGDLSKLDELSATLAAEAAGISSETVRERTPIGFPSQFFTEQGTGFQPFRDGDEWEPMSMSPGDKLRYQLILHRAGLLSEIASPGVWDPHSAQAYSGVLAMANAKQSRDIEAVLGEFAEQAQTYGTKVKKPRQPLTLAYANPESVRQVVREASFKMLGKRLGDAEEQSLVSAYQAQYTAAQQAQYAATGEGGGSYTEPMSPDEFAASRLERRPEAFQQRYLQGFDEALKVLTGTVTPIPRGALGG